MKKYCKILKNILSWDDCLTVSLVDDKIKILSDSIICSESLRDIIFFANSYKLRFYITCRMINGLARPCIFIKKDK